MRHWIISHYYHRSHLVFLNPVNEFNQLKLGIRLRHVPFWRTGSIESQIATDPIRCEFPFVAIRLTPVHSEIYIHVRYRFVVHSWFSAFNKFKLNMRHSDRLNVSIGYAFSPLPPSFAHASEKKRSFFFSSLSIVRLGVGVCIYFLILHFRPITIWLDFASSSRVPHQRTQNNNKIHFSDEKKTGNIETASFQCSPHTCKHTATEIQRVQYIDALPNVRSFPCRWTKFIVKNFGTFFDCLKLGHLLIAKQRDTFCVWLYECRDKQTRRKSAKT